MSHSLLFRQLRRILQQAHGRNLKHRRKSGVSPWTRRRFLKMTMMATGSAIATTLPRTVKSQDNPRIAIIGGGLAGLNAAYQLKKQGYQATVYEARSRLGGRIYTRHNMLKQGLYLDWGGLFINSDHQDILSLVQEFNLSLFNVIEAGEKVSIPHTSYFFNRQYLSETDLVENLRSLASQIAADAALLDQDFEQYAPVLDKLSIAKYLEQHQAKITTPEIYLLIENGIRSEYGVELTDSSALQLIFMLPTVEEENIEMLGNSDETYLIQGGNSELINNLSQALSDQIQTNRSLTKLEQNRNNFLLTFANSDVIEADYVILAIPFTTLKNVELQVDLPDKLRRFITEVDLGRNDKYFVHFEERLWQVLEKFFTEIWNDFGYSMAWDSTTRIIGRDDGILTFFHGGNDVQKMHNFTTKNYGEKLISDLEIAVSGIKKVASKYFKKTNWLEEFYTKGSYTNFKPGQLSEFAEWFYIESDTPQENQKVAIGNLIFAGEQFSDEYYGYMNGAAQTGRLAAEIIIRG